MEQNCEKRMTTRELALLEATAQIVVAALGSNIVHGEGLPKLISETHAALSRLGEPQAAEAPRKPAVDPRKSVQADYIVCLEDGKRFKSLKRHLMAYYGLTPDQYREKWGLPASYPIVAPNYAAKRSALAKKTGLGKHRLRVVA